MIFNTKEPQVMHIDLNSCFATIEQQANPFLRGKPVAVAAYTTPSGCIIAPSIEAKKLGIKVGMRVKDGKMICPGLIILSPDPWKYRNVHLMIRKIISSYTDDFTPKSIDEFCLNLEGYPILFRMNPQEVGKDIKKRIKKEVGEYLTVSIGIGPNRFLAKLASGLHKPDGLDIIDKNNFLDIYKKLSLTDLNGIKLRNTIRLNSVGIYTVNDFYGASIQLLRSAFKSIGSYYWYLRLRGWEIDDFNFKRSSYGNSFALPTPFSTPNDLSPILSKLVEKMSARIRAAGYKAGGIHLSVLYRDGGYWHKGMKLETPLFDGRDIYKKAFGLLLSSNLQKPVRELAVSVFNLSKNKFLQLDIFNDQIKKESLVKGIDLVNNRWGNFVITPARMLLGKKEDVPDRIAFGGIKELEEFTLS